MPPVLSHADALREYLTGATSDGGSQSNANLCFGGFRSSTEAISFGIQIQSALPGVTVLYASGGNGSGTGTLSAVDSTHLTWQAPNSSVVGSPAIFSGSSDTEIVEDGTSPGSYLRITGTTPFTVGQSQVILSYLYDNVFGFDDLTPAEALSGLSEYRATIIRNESAFGAVSNFQRYLATLGTPQTSNNAGLPSTGAGVISTSGSFADWPQSGWCQVQSSSHTLKEVVYYSSRTDSVLTVPATGRGLLGTSATMGLTTDLVNPVPGIALAIDPDGVQSFGSSIQTIANANTAPSGVSWTLGLTPATGLQVGSVAQNQQVGIWMWRQIPAGAVATPQQLTKVLDSFSTY